MLLALSPYPSSSYTMTTPRSSSPLNPNGMRSSSPLSSPTPGSSSGRAYQSFSTPIYKNSSPSRIGGPSISTRYIRPSKKNSNNLPPLTSSSNGNDLFSEGTTPMEGLMWREKFSRRVEERERRKNKRNQDLDKRRGTTPIINRQLSVEEEDELDRKAQEDDEEIFRRLVILQRKKTQHANLVSHEVETGGSDPLQPEFWEDELLVLENEERELMRRLDDEHGMDIRHHQQYQIHPPSIPQYTQQITLDQQHQNQNQNYDEEWEKEAAIAEQQELDFEQIQFANQVERAYHSQQISQQQYQQIHVNNTGMEIDNDIGMEVDWEAFDSMDIE